MPELPEVETVRALLEPLVQGKIIDHVDVYREKNIDGDALLFASSLRDKHILKVCRKGKLLAFVFSDNLAMTSHLRMEGKYFYQDPVEPRGKHDIFRLNFTDGSALVYNDVRKFGRVKLHALQDGDMSPCFEGIADEPFHLSAEELAKRLRSKTIPIKEAIMDQSIVSGIGNIYADEALFASKIHPLIPANDLSVDELGRILKNASEIMSIAIADGGATIRSYHPGKGIDGLMQLRLQAYGRSGQPCPCCGAKMRRITVNGRGTTYCPICQKPLQKPFVLGVTGPIHAGKSTVSAYFASNGYLLFDADKVASQSYGNASCKKKILTLLGDESYLGDEPNRAYIRTRINEDPGLKRKLERIIHPFVISQAKKFIAHAKPSDKIVLDVPLLFPSGMDQLCDATVLVVSSPASSASRLAVEGKDVTSMLELNKNYPLDEAMKKADVIIHNDAGIDELRNQLEQLLAA